MNEIWVAVLTGSFALLGVGVTLWFEKKRSALDHARWYADHFLGDKLSSLKTLHVALVDCHFTMNHYGNAPPQTLAEFKEKVSPKEERYLQAMVMASIYLNESERSVFSKALGAFRQASMAIWLSLPDDQIPVNKQSYVSETRNLNWGLFAITYEDARRLLEEKLNPESLKKMDAGNVTT